MHINLITIPFVIVLGIVFSQRDTSKNRRWYIILSSFILLLVAALRSPEYMTNTYNIDTLNYRGYFEQVFDMDWSEFQRLFYLRYIAGADDFDVGFLALNKLISLFTHEFWLYSLIADLIFFVPFGLLLYRYCTKSSQIMFAFVFYISLVQIFFLGGARQMFSLGFDLMALLAVIDKKRIRAIIFFLIGMTIHFSSLLFALPLLAIWFDLKPNLLKVLHSICFIVFPVVLAFPNQMIQFMGNTVGMEKYAEYGANAVRGGSETFIFLIELLSLFCLLSIKRNDLANSRTLRYFYVMAPLLTFFAPLIISNGSMIRISLYYHLFLTLLVPFAIDCAFSKANRNIAYIAAIGALSLLSLSGGGLTYYFFWQV